MKLNQKGMTLVEVVASIVIISIVLLSVAQIILQSNKNAHVNNDKLVVINLAESVLERLKVQHYIVSDSLESVTPTEGGQIEIPLENLDIADLTKKTDTSGNTYYLFEINDETYLVNAYTKKEMNEELKELKLQKVQVKVKHVKVKTNSLNQITDIEYLIGTSDIEGYVKL